MTKQELELRITNITTDIEYLTVLLRSGNNDANEALADDLIAIHGQIFEVLKIYARSKNISP